MIDCDPHAEPRARRPPAYLVSLSLALLLAACEEPLQPARAPDSPVSTATPALSVAADHSSAVVMWHAQQAPLGNVGPVEGASAHLVRTANGISFRITTNSLTPGNAYTLWVAVIDDPEACKDAPCSAADILLQEATKSQVRYASGAVVGGSGKATFAGSVKAGLLSGWLSDRSFDNPMGAEVHLVINDHGPKVPALMPSMIHTYRGGCADESPFPPIFPESALADGEVGPNICRLAQAAIFAP